MSEHDDRQPDIRITISPSPSDDEIAAVAAVVTALAASAGEAGESDTRPQVERWALVGRHEAMRGALWPQDLRD
jgi:hypothetical protein